MLNLNFLDPKEKAIIDRLFSKYQSTHPLNAKQMQLIYDYAAALLKRLERVGFGTNVENRRPRFSSIFGINHKLITLFENRTNLAGGLFLLNEAIKVIDQNAKQAQIDFEKFKQLDHRGFDPTTNYDNLLNAKVFYHLLLQAMFAKFDPQSQWVINDGITNQLQFEKYLNLIADLGPYGADLVLAINQGVEIKSFDQVNYFLENHGSNVLVYEYHNQKQIPLTKKQFNVKVANQQPLNYFDHQFPIKIDGISVDGFNDQIEIINRNANYQLDLSPHFYLPPLNEQIVANQVGFDPQRYWIEIRNLNDQYQPVLIDQNTNQISSTLISSTGKTYDNIKLNVNQLNPSQININDQNGKYLVSANLKPTNLATKDYFDYFETWISPKLWLNRYLTKLINPQLVLSPNLVLLNFRNLKTIDGMQIENYFLNDAQFYATDGEQNAKLAKAQNFRKSLHHEGWSPYYNYRYLADQQAYQPLTNPNKHWIKSDQFATTIKQIISNYYQKFPLVYLGYDHQLEQPILVAYDDQRQISDHFSLKLNRSYQEDKIERLQTELSLENPHLWEAQNFLKPYDGQFGTHWNYNILPTASMLNYDFDWQWWQTQITTWKDQPQALINRYLAKGFSSQQQLNHDQVDWNGINQFSKVKLSPWWQAQRELIAKQVQKDYPNDLAAQYEAGKIALDAKMQTLIFFQKILANKFGYLYDYENDQYHPYQNQTNMILTYGHWMEPLIIDQINQAIKNNQNELVTKYFPNYLNQIEDLQVITDKRTLMFRDTLYDSGLEQLVDIDGLVVDRKTKRVLAIIECKTGRTMPGDRYYHSPTVQYRHQISLYAHLFQQPLVLAVSARIADPRSNVRLKESLAWQLEPIVLTKTHFQDLKATYDLWIKTYQNYFVNAINPFTNQFDQRLADLITNAFANGLKSAPCFEQAPNPTNQVQSLKLNR